MASPILLRQVYVEITIMLAREALVKPVYTLDGTGNQMGEMIDH